MKIVVADFETHFDSKSYTLSKLTTESYIRDPRFEAHGCAIKFGPDLPAKWWNRHELPDLFKQIDWSDVFLISHHAQFDHLILSHHYNVHPKMSGCTLSMARLMLGNHLSVGLEAVRKHFGMPSKTTPYGLFDGKHWDEMPPAVQQQIGDGAVDEVESIFAIFQKLMADRFPVEELEVVDTTIKMFSEPVLRADVDLLAKVWESQAISKANNMAALNVTEADLQSSDRFAQLLRDEGVEPETKPGKPKADGTPRFNYAFAKNDEFMKQLLEVENERIRTLAEARLGVKSTLLQTRAETLGWMASRGPMPVYLRYAGAGTLRFSGGDNTNFQNFKRGSDIRRAIMAPPGYLLAPIDSSQIECRVLHFLAGGPDEPVIQLFRRGEDPYVDIASQFYNEKIYKPKSDDPRKAEMEAKRGMGKQGRLMCCAADTKVLTNSGWKRIINVSIVDLLWDGIEWIHHQGLVYQGERTVENYSGVKMTSDHQTLCGPQHWLPAVSLRNENILSQALAVASANLPSAATKLAARADCKTWLFGVPAERQSIPSILQTSMLGAVRAVMRALKKRGAIGLKNITATPIFAPMNFIGAGYFVASRSFIIAAAQTVKMNGTGGEVSKFTRRGGEKMDGVNFSHIWLRFPAGMFQNWKLIEKIITKAIGLATFNLRREVNKCAIDEASSNWKQKLPVYDLSFAGPRNRFTILSDRGPLIVHNCGYGASGKQFKMTAKAGLYGPPVDISIEDSTRFVALYRDTNPSICAPRTGYWAQASRNLARLAGGNPLDWGPLHIRDHRIYLPNGCPIIYDTLEFHKPGPDEEVKEFEVNGYWRVKTRSGWKTMWGSKLVQNICEAVSRVIVTQAMVRIVRMGYRVLNIPHDELLVLITQDGQEQQHLERCMAEMKVTPNWLPGIPLDCEGTLSERYSK